MPSPSSPAGFRERPVPIWLLALWVLVGTLLAILAILSIRRGEALWLLLGSGALWLATLGFGLAWHRSSRLGHSRDMSERDARYRMLLEQTREAVLIVEEGKVAYAGIDVFEGEPIIKKELRDHPNVSLSPHIGGSTKEAQERIGVELATKVVQYFKSK